MKAERVVPCPCCNSPGTKFCNHNVNWPRHFCKNCQHYWTAGDGSKSTDPAQLHLPKSSSVVVPSDQIMSTDASLLLLGEALLEASNKCLNTCETSLGREDWNRIPPEIQDNIFSRLHFLDVFRLRSVSIGWCSSLSSPSFLTSLPAQPWILMGHFSTRSPSLEKVALLDNFSGCSPNLPFCFQHCSIPHFKRDTTAVAGLLAIKTQSKPTELYVVNPLNNHFVNISTPDSVGPDGIFCSSFALLANHVDKTYTIYHINDIGELFSYHSQRRCWKTLPISPRNVNPQSIVVDSTYLFVLPISYRDNEGILVYQIKEAKWSVMEVHPTTVQNSRYHHLVNFHKLLLYKGELLLAAIMYDDDIRTNNGENEASVRIWKLKSQEGHTTAEWIEIARTNHKFSIYVDRYQQNCCKFMLMGDLICFIPEGKSCWPLLVYDLVSGIWQCHILDEYQCCVSIIQPHLAFDP